MTFADKCATYGVYAGTILARADAASRGHIIGLSEALNLLRWSRIGQVSPQERSLHHLSRRSAELQGWPTWVWKP